MSKVTTYKPSPVFLGLYKIKQSKKENVVSVVVDEADGWATQACVVVLLIYQKEKAKHDPPMRPIALDSCNPWFEHHLFDENGQRASPTATSPTGSLSLFSLPSLNPTTLLFSF